MRTPGSAWSSASVYGLARRWALLVACGLGVGPILSAEAGPGATTVLPRVEASAQVPIVKVAEFRMRVARFAPAAVAHGDYLYIIGGSNEGDSVLDSIERFNVRTGRSEEFSRLQVARQRHRALVVNDTICVLGGETSFHTGLTLEPSVEIVDLATGKVTPGVEMPTPRAEFGCVLLGGKIYVIGGIRLLGTKRNRTNTVDVFDLNSRRWSPGVPMPTPRETQATLIDGPYIVVPGGFDGNRALNEVEFFNPRDASWRSLPPLCRSTSAHSLIFLGHHLFLFGDYGAPAELLAYDLATRRSETFTLRYESARHTAAVVHQGRIYVIGGRVTRASGELNLIQVYALRSKP